jgi:hypothetical protein
MPSKSPAQKRLMEGIAHGWTPSRLKRPPSKQVAEDFVAADQKRKRGIAGEIAKRLGRKR